MGKRARLALIVVGALAVLVCAAGAAWGWNRFQDSPAAQYRAARERWETRRLRHYRLSANYTHQRAQCHYDIEVRDEAVQHVYGLTCLSAASVPSLTVTGIFKTFEPYATRRICAATGCYCDGTYEVRASYDPAYGYPLRIGTRFRRNWLDDLLHGQLGKMTCLRADVTIERLEVVSLEPLP